MQRKNVAIVGALLLGAVIGTYILTNRNSEAPPPIAQAPRVPSPTATLSPPPAPQALAEPIILHPLTVTPPTESLPELDKSDALLLKALGDVLGKKGLSFMRPGEVIHRFVATVDNLPRPTLPAAIVPLKRTQGPFMVSGVDDTRVIDARNSERYSKQVKLIRTINAKKLVAVYRTFYPLFQSAYEDLGYPKAYFNDRLIVAIDDLLASPVVEEPVHLVQPKVLYEFADPDLAARSAGQKIMIRMGHSNAESVKATLREIRHLVTQAPG